MVPEGITKKKGNEIIKREQQNFLQENDDVEEQRLNKKASNVHNSRKAITKNNLYEDIFRTLNKKAIG